jgi:hypothetical protein
MIGGLGSGCGVGEPGARVEESVLSELSAGLRNALIAAIALLLGIGVVGAIVKSGDDGGGSAASVTTTTGGISTTGSPAHTTTTAPPIATTTTAAGAPTTVAGKGTGSGSGSGSGSGLATGGTGEVAAGAQTAETGGESLLGPGLALVALGGISRRIRQR